MAPILLTRVDRTGILSAIEMRRRYSPFERRIRTAARLSLYGSLLVAGLAAWLGSRVLQPSLASGEDWTRVNYGALAEVQLLQEYLRIDTSYPTGSELSGAEFLAAQLKAAGIAATIERIGTDQANLWAILEGEDPSALVLHQHIDTDPVENPEAWSHSPWSGDIDGPWIYGRGAFDMKSVSIAQLVAMIDLKKSGLPLRRAVILLATGSEERGSDVGVKRVLREHPELAGRFWAALTEGGVVEARASDDLKYWGTEFTQRRQVEVRVCSHDRARLEGLVEDLKAHGLETAPELGAAAEAYLRAYAPSREAPPLRWLLSNPAVLLQTPNGMDEVPQPLHGVFSSGCYPGRPQAHPGSGFEVVVQCLLLPGREFAAVAADLLPKWITHGLSVRVREVSEPAEPSSLEHLVYRTLQEELVRQFPQGDRGPWVQGAFSASDARFFRPAGIPTYGFSPFPFLVTDTMRIGLVDEHVGLKGFVAGLEVYRRLVARLAT